MTPTVTPYATDEDVALRASADFPVLCPRDQRLAYGTDGAFLPGDGWTLTSARVDFASNGLAPGHVVLLTQPVLTFKPPGDSFGVVSVSRGSVRLRRKGVASGVGQPAAGPDGAALVEFTVATLGPQIERASYDLNRRYGIDDLVAGRRPCDLFDPREVLEATVLTVLYRQYLEMSRGSEERADTFATKARLYKDELGELLARAVLHWAAVPGAPAAPQPSTRMGTRLSR